MIAARERQQERFSTDGHTNLERAHDATAYQAVLSPPDESQELIRIAMTELNLSARAYDRILKVSRTIADLAGRDEITPEHVSEAIQYRTFDRTLWV